MGFAGQASKRGAVRLEAENGKVTGGVQIATSRAGWEGKGYATHFTAAEDTIVWENVKAVPGLYALRLRYSSPRNQKGYDFAVNGLRFGGMFPPTGDGWAIHEGGKVEMSASNTIILEKGWGYYDIDYVELVPTAPYAPPRRPPLVLADRAATARTRALHRYLVGQYGSHTLSGQYDPPDTALVQSVTGRTPAVYGADFIEYSPSRREHGADPKNLTEDTIKRLKVGGQISTMTWHWNAPRDLLDKMETGADGKPKDLRWYRGFYTEATTFDIVQALSDPHSPTYALLLRDMDVVAAELKKFAAADIPVLWRPLHEAEGGWFWWGAKGPAPYIKLWRLMYDRFTNRHGLHNLIWVHNCVRRDWYPGDDVVDVVGVDAYPSDVRDPLSDSWAGLQSWLNGKKLLALTEFGGVPDVARMHRFGVRWSYFVSWSGFTARQTRSTLAPLYHAPAVSNRENLRIG